MKVRKIAVSCLTAGCLALGSVGIVAYAAGNPYESYKDAVTGTIMQQNLTANASVLMKQDGNVIASGSGVYEKDGTTQYSKINSNILGQSTISEEYADASVRVQSDGTAYSTKSAEKKQDAEENENLSPNMMKLAQMTADLFVGDLSNQFVSNGSTISVSLTGTQIPEIANVAAAAFTEMNGGKPARDKGDLENQLMQEFPIASNAKIESVDMSAEISGGNISKQTATLVLSGKKTDGSAATVEITIDADITEIGTTTPQKIDTSALTENANIGEDHED